MFLGAILFIIFFIAIAPQSRAFLLAAATGAGVWVADWAPFSYILLVILVAAPFAGMHLVRSAPLRVEEGNPMAKYRNEVPLDEE